MKQSTAIALLGAAAVAVVLVVGVIFLWPGEEAPQGPPPLPAGTRNFGNWALACVNDQDGVKRCALLMRVLDQETRRMLLNISLTRGPQGNAIFQIITPPSVVNTAGVTIQPVDPPQNATGNAARGLFQRCTPQMCLGILMLTEELATQMAAMPQIRVQYVAGNGRQVNYPLPSAGFGPGYAAWQMEYPRPAPATPAPTEGVAPAPAPAGGGRGAAAPAAPAGGGRGAAAPAAAAPAAPAPAPAPAPAQ
jgi:invasion protein IalB